jgi:hypothetical protein
MFVQKVINTKFRGTDGEEENTDVIIVMEIKDTPLNLLENILKMKTMCC